MIQESRDQTSLICFWHEGSEVRIHSGKRALSVNSRRKLLGVSKDVHVQEWKRVIIFQFESEPNIRMFGRKVRSEFDNMFICPD